MATRVAVWPAVWPAVANPTRVLQASDLDDRGMAAGPGPPPPPRCLAPHVCAGCCKRAALRRLARQDGLPA